MKRYILFFLIAFMIGGVVFADISTERREALQSLQARAMQGDPKALYDLAYLYDTGYDSIPVDSVKSTILYRLSAEKGYAPAQNYLGFRYFNGEAIRQDIDSALFWMAKAAGAGDVKAANNIGFLLATSDKVSRDYPQAVYWLTMAADAGLPAAQATLADLVRLGLGTRADTLKAVSLYNRAIEGGLADAALKLLNMMGPTWEKLPADSAVDLGKYYYLHGAPVIGVQLFENASTQGNADADALLGDAYSRAIGAEYDYDKSLHYFLRAALNGNPSSQFVIAELLEMYPDALEEPAAQEVVYQLFDPEIDDIDSIMEIITDPAFWYSRASQSGVNTAEDAFNLLLQ